MDLFINDASSNMIAKVQAQAVPRIGEELLLMSIGKRYAVTDIVHIFNSECVSEGYIVQVVAIGVEDNTHKCELPEWLQLVY